MKRSLFCALSFIACVLVWTQGLSQWARASTWALPPVTRKAGLLEAPPASCRDHCPQVHWVEANRGKEATPGGLAVIQQLHPAKKQDPECLAPRRITSPGEGRVDRRANSDSTRWECSTCYSCCYRSWHLLHHRHLPKTATSYHLTPMRRAIIKNPPE